MLGGFCTHEDAIDNPYSTALDKTYLTIAYFAPSLGYYRSPSDQNADKRRP
jgi:hypothetical protein